MKTCCVYVVVALFVYKFLSSGTPGSFSHTLLPYSCKYNTRRGSIQKMFLEVPQFCPPVHKSNKQFNNSLAFDATAIWNALPDDIRSAPSITSFRKRLKSHLFEMAFPP